MKEENQKAVLDDPTSDPPSTVDDELEDDEERISLMTMVKGLKKKVSEMEVQMENSGKNKSRRSLGSKRDGFKRHNIMSRKSVISTHALMMPVHEEYADDDESIDDEDERTFPNNTFSFLLLAKYPLIGKRREEEEETDGGIAGGNEETNTSPSHNSPDYLCLPFWLAIAILSLQVTIYTLALQNATDFDNPKNPFAFPINVDVNTRAAELLAVVIAVYTQNNIFQGFDLYMQSFKHIGQIPGVTKWKYYTAATTQVIVGVYGIFVTFIIIMQADNVVDLLLDFTAMEFVAALDDAAFFLSLRGFLGSLTRKAARNVLGVRYRPRDKRKWLRKWPMFMVFVALLSCYIVVRIHQDDRVFGDNQVYVQFHDSAIPWLSSLSGSYFGCAISTSDLSDLTAGKTTNVGKIIYTKLPVKDCHKKWRNEQAAFFYCEQKNWVLAVGEDMLDPCQKWTMQSFSANPKNTDEYDLTSHATDLWFAKDPRNISDDGVLEGIQFLPSYVPLEKTKLVCNVLDAKGIVFSFPLYERLQDVLICDRPVYFAGDSRDAEYVFYIGRRWVVVRESVLALDCLAECGDSSESFFSCRSECLKSSFDPFTSNYTAHLISDPMDLRTTGDTWVPGDELQWYKATGRGSSSKPETDKTSLAQQIQEIPVLLQAVIERQATPEQLAEAEALFAQSATLACICRDKEACPGIASCPTGESKLWIDLKTDNFAEETLFLVMGKNRWESIQAESRMVYDIDNWYETAEFATNFAVLNNTGFFPWQDVKSGTLENMDEYMYTTCIPENECSILYFRDTFGDGIYFPGGFDVYVDGSRIAINEADTQDLRHCVYQFGKSCGQSVQCSSAGFEFEDFAPQVSCPEGSTPLAFEVLPSDQNRSLTVSDLDSWLLSENFPAMEEIGFFDWEAGMQTPALNTFQTFRYATCVPNSVCAVMSTEYAYDSVNVIYNGQEIELSEEQYWTNYCLYQLGPACDTEIRCSNTEISLPYNPTIECPGGGKSLAIDFQADDFSHESKVVVTDLEGWNQELWSNASSTLNETGYFDWRTIQIDSFAYRGTFRYSTCVPDSVCGVVALLDSYGDGLTESGGIKVFYDQEEIPIAKNNADSLFQTCQFQFGACQQEAYCTASGLSTAPSVAPIN